MRVIYKALSVLSNTELLVLDCLLELKKHDHPVCSALTLQSCIGAQIQCLFSILKGSLGLMKLFEMLANGVFTLPFMIMFLFRL